MSRPNRIGRRPGVAQGWSLVIPVKRAAEGKTRLQIDGVDHEQLARSIALDTILAAARSSAVGGIQVVTSDAVTARMLAGLEGLAVTPDPGAGLTAALRAGLAAVGRHRHRAVLLGDLPALRPDELTRALHLASAHRRAFVPDAEGVGSVLATACGGASFPALFGAGSAAAHRAAGFAELPISPHAGLRRDIDLAQHLHDVHALGPRTAAVYALATQALVMT